MEKVIIIKLEDGQGIEFYEDNGIVAVLLDEKGEGLAHERLSQSQIDSLKALLDTCIHEKTEHINIPGSYERITVCNDCGQEL